MLHIPLSEKPSYIKKPTMQKLFDWRNFRYALYEKQQKVKEYLEERRQIRKTLRRMKRNPFKAMINGGFMVESQKNEENAMKRNANDAFGDNGYDAGDNDAQVNHDDQPEPAALPVSTLTPVDTPPSADDGYDTGYEAGDDNGEVHTTAIATDSQIEYLNDELRQLNDQESFEVLLGLVMMGGDHTMEFSEHAETIFHLAAKQGQITALERLVKVFGKENMLRRRNSGETPLHIFVTQAAIQGWDGPVFENQLAKILEISPIEILEMTDNNNHTPLRTAVYWNGNNVVRALIARGANAKFADTEGFTLLMQAADLGDLEMYRMLRAAGADPKAIDSSRKGVLYYSALSTEDSVEIFRQFVDEFISDGLDLRALDIEGIPVEDLLRELGRNNQNDAEAVAYYNGKADCLRFR